MLRRYVALMLALLSLFLFGCRDGMLTPSEDKFSPDNSTRLVSVYIDGAVENSGYHSIAEGTDVQTAVLGAVLCEYGVLPTNGLEFVSDKMLIIVDFVDDNGNRRSCVNANGLAVRCRAEIEGISAVVVDVLADFLEQNGTVRNRHDLAKALGRHYQQNYYKFYVSEEDYCEQS